MSEAFSQSPAPSLADIAAIGARAFAALPEPFRSLAADVVLKVEDYIDEAELQADEDPLEISGLYCGPSLAERSPGDSMVGGSVILLYRMPILFEWAERGDVSLYDLVSHVLVHEIGHHFGLTDGDIDHLEAD